MVKRIGYGANIGVGSPCRVPTGKTKKMGKRIPCQGKHREFGHFAKTQGKQGI